MRTRDNLYPKESRVALKRRMGEYGIDTGEYHQNHVLLHEALLIYRDRFKYDGTLKDFAGSLNVPRSVMDYRVRTARIALRCILRDVSDDTSEQLAFLMNALDCDNSIAKLIYENIGGA